ncbi:MAG TPA: ribbon-helix-helix domain-containing protein [Gammaproteobacteria bacterium]
MRPGKKRIALDLTAEQGEKLVRLSAVTRIPQQVLLREAADDLFKKYRRTLAKGKRS